MRDYGKVHVAFWQSPTVLALNDDGKMLALYLLTTQHGNLIGCYRLPDAYVAEDLNWTVERVREAFRETVSKGFANRCETSKWVYLPQFLKFNPLENPNQRIAATKLWAQVPNDVGFRDLVEPLRNPSKTVSEPVAVAVDVTEAVKTPQPPKGGCPGFDEFIASYPNRKAKAAAKRAWDKLNPDEILRARISRAVIAAKATETWRKDDGRYVPLPATWLNGKRWEDELPSVQGGSDVTNLFSRAV